ncbi:MAG: hypothetical protein ACRC2T_09490, partial [Thermoguttaceae bacterium]
MKQTKTVFLFVLVLFALYGVYSLVAKKPANNSVSEDFIDELAAEGIIITDTGGQDPSGMSDLFGNLEIGSGTSSNSSALSARSGSQTAAPVSEYEDTHF